MKIKLLLLILLCTQQAVFSQKKTGYKEAVYELTLRNETGLEKLMLEQVRYIVSANDSLYFIEAEGTAQAEEEHVHTKLSGPQKIYFDMNKDVILFDTDSKELCRFNPVLLKQIDMLVKIDKYNCKLFLSNKNDSLFISTELPYFVNPFCLSAKSIEGAVVRAVLANGTVFELTAVKERDEVPFDKNIFPLNMAIKNKDNIFFGK